MSPPKQHLHLFLVGVRCRHALAQKTVQISQTARAGQHALHERRGLGMARHRGQGLAQGRHRVVHVTGLVAAPRDLAVQTHGPLRAIRSGPLGVGEDRGQGIQSLVIARVEPHHIAQLLGRLL